MKYALLALSMGAAVTKNMVSRAGKAAFGSGRGMLPIWPRRRSV